MATLKTFEHLKTLDIKSGEKLGIPVHPILSNLVEPIFSGELLTGAAWSKKRAYVMKYLKSGPTLIAIQRAIQTPLVGSVVAYHYENHYYQPSLPNDYC